MYGNASLNFVNSEFTSANAEFLLVYHKKTFLSTSMPSFLLCSFYYKMYSNSTHIPSIPERKRKDRISITIISIKKYQYYYIVLITIAFIIQYR